METLTVRTHSRRGRQSGGSAKSNAVCYFWKEGKCNRNPCRFLHRDSPAPVPAPSVFRRALKLSPLKDQLKKNLKYALGYNIGGSWLGDKSNKKPMFCDEDVPKNCPGYNPKKPFVSQIGSCGFETVKDQECYNPSTEDPPRKQPNLKELVTTTQGGVSEDKITQECSVSATEALDLKRMKEQKSCSEDSPKDTVVLTPEDIAPEVKIPLKKQQKVCEQWMSGSCVEGEGCRFMHSWFHGDGFSMLAKLDGHSEAVSGIVLPSGSDKLYSSSKDGSLSIWDCHTGQLVGVMNLGEKIGSLISEGPWIFVGMPNFVKIWNIQKAADFSLNGQVGQVHAMAAADNMLFAGAQNGAILVWKGSGGNVHPIQLAASLEGHTDAVTCLAVGAKRLCSGSMDGTINVWDLDTLQCIETLNGHADAVMSLVFWSHQYLLSCSLDGTIKVWFAAQGSSFALTHTHHEGHGAVALCGVNDADAKPVLLCSCNDKSVRLYDLPSFSERGRIFSKQVVSTIQAGPNGLFFTGNGTGLLNVWKWAGHNVAA